MAFASEDFLDSDEEIAQLARMGMFGDTGFQMTTLVADSMRKKNKEDEDYNVDDDLRPSRSTRKRTLKTMTEEDEQGEQTTTTTDSATLPPSSISAVTSTTTTNNSSPAAKKRKKARAWSAEEEARYLEGLELFGRDWTKLVEHVGSRDAGAIRSHTQLHFMKLLKNGSGLPAKVAESGNGYTLSGKPLNKYSSSVLRVFGRPEDVPNVDGVISDQEEAEKHKFKKKRESSTDHTGSDKQKKKEKSQNKKTKKGRKGRSKRNRRADDSDESSDEFKASFAANDGPLRRSTRERSKRGSVSLMKGWSEEDPFNLRTEMEPYGSLIPQPFSVSFCPNGLLLADLHCHLCSEFEVMGLLAGHYHNESRHVHITRAVPLREELSNPQEVTACAVSQIEAVNEIVKDGMVVVGWYHSHPTFENYPSNRDCEQHWSHSSGSHTPYVGLIIGSWSSQGDCSDYRWFNIERESMSDYLPYQLSVQEKVTMNADDSWLFQQMDALIERYADQTIYQQSMITNLCQIWRAKITREDKILISLKSHMRLKQNDDVNGSNSGDTSSDNRDALCGRIMTLFRRNKQSWFRDSSDPTSSDQP